jgi:chromate reductase
MHKIVPQVRLVGLPGSLRKTSFSRATLVGLRDNLPEKVTLDILELQLRLYNQDDDRDATGVSCCRVGPAASATRFSSVSQRPV